MGSLLGIVVATISAFVGGIALVGIGRRQRETWVRWLFVAVGGALSAAAASVVALFVYLLTHVEAKGRVLRIRNRARLAERGSSPGWAEPVSPELADLGVVERALVAEAWHLSARMEHASIAAFSDLSLTLLALGAPGDLIERSHRAALDEIAHARLCYSLASAFADRTIGPGPIEALVERERREVDLARLACGSLVDGCLAEGIAAEVAARGSRNAADPRVRSVFATIARDEATHAELGWAIVEYCLAVGGAETAQALRACAGRLGERITPRLRNLPGISDAAIERHGFLGQDALGEISRVAVERSVTRCLALCASVEARRAA